MAVRHSRNGHHRDAGHLFVGQCFSFHQTQLSYAGDCAPSDRPANSFRGLPFFSGRCDDLRRDETIGTFGSLSKTNADPVSADRTVPNLSAIRLFLCRTYLHLRHPCVDSHRYGFLFSDSVCPLDVSRRQNRLAQNSRFDHRFFRCLVGQSLPWCAFFLVGDRVSVGAGIRNVRIVRQSFGAKRNTSHGRLLFNGLANADRFDRAHRCRCGSDRVVSVPLRPALPIDSSVSRLCLGRRFPAVEFGDESASSEQSLCVPVFDPAVRLADVKRTVT